MPKKSTKKAVSTISAANVKVLNQYSHWTQFFAILSYIGAGILIFLSLIMVIAIFGIGLIFVGTTYGVLAWVSIWSGKKLQKSSRAASQIVEGDSLENYYEHTSTLLSEVRTYFKIQGIVTVVSLILTALSIALYILVFGFAIAAGDEQFQFESNINKPSLFIED